MRSCLSAWWKGRFQNWMGRTNSCSVCMMGTWWKAFSCGISTAIPSVFLPRRDAGWGVCSARRRSAVSRGSFCLGDAGAGLSDPEDHRGESHNVVIMGTGEPLDNYDNFLRFVRILTDEHGLHISQRNVTVSTCGNLCPGCWNWRMKSSRSPLRCPCTAPLRRNGAPLCLWRINTVFRGALRV